MLFVEALAGTGKSTTAGFGMGTKVPRGIKLSDEQKAIVRIMRGCRGTKAACAFNRSIAQELPEKMPAGVECATSNAFGHRAWAKHLGVSRLQVDGLKTRRLCRDILEKRYDFKERLRIEAAVDKYVALCKCYMFDPVAKDKKNWIEKDIFADGMGVINWLAGRFDIDADPVVVEMIPEVWAKAIEPTKYIDYNDQNFMPLYHGAKMPTYDHLFLDELQDLNRAKQLMAFKMGTEITAVGDRNQAIYGFSGADSDAMDNMLEKMKECKETTCLPLTITRRCPKSVVKLANTIVPSLRCPDDAPEGSVSSVPESKFHESMLKMEPAMVLCRINAPLTALAFKLIANNRRAFIQGRDIGSGIKAEVKRSQTSNFGEAISKVNDRIEKKCLEISQREFPDDDQIEALNDKKSCINILSDDCDNMREFESKVDGLFKDSGGPNDIQLSSCHKAKGLEHKRVFIYKANKLRLNAKQQFQREQENNIAYVAYTRSMDELTLVNEESDNAKKS